MKRLWIYLINPFLIATRRSFKLTLQLSTKHDAALAAVKDINPFFANLYAAYHAMHLVYDAMYNKWKVQGGAQKGETLNLKQLLRLLSKTKIGDWERAIHDLYPPDSPQYMALLPNRKAPFQTGDQLSRIIAVETLSEALATDTSLIAVKTSVDLFYARLLASNTTQKGSKSFKKMLRDALEAERVIICTELFSNYASLTINFKHNPENVVEFFDIPSLRDKEQTLFAGKVKANHLHTIKQHTFHNGDNLRILNNGTEVLKFYLAQRRNGNLPSPLLEVQAGEERVVAAEQLGDLANTFLIVKNEQSGDGHFEVEML